MNSLPDCYSPVSLKTQTLFPKLYVLGIISQAQVLKAEVPHVEFESFAPWSGASGFEFSQKLWVAVLRRSITVKLCPSFSYLLQYGFLFIGLVNIHHSARFRFS